MSLETISVQELYDAQENPNEGLETYWAYGPEMDIDAFQAITRATRGLYVVGGEGLAIAQNTQLTHQGIDLVPPGMTVRPQSILRDTWSPLMDEVVFHNIRGVSEVNMQTRGTLFAWEQSQHSKITKAIREWNLFPNWGWQTEVGLKMTEADQDPVKEGERLEGGFLTMIHFSEPRSLSYTSLADGLNYDPHLAGKESTLEVIENFHKNWAARLEAERLAAEQEAAN